MNITVRNFQSIENVSVSVDGFTALVGRSGIGKSALVRAVRAALTGAGGTAFVRHPKTCPRRTKGAKTCSCYCSVHLQSDGFDLLWEKGDKRNRYTFNGQVYDRTDQGAPDFLLAPQLSPGFDPVTVGRENKLIQVASQFTDNVFLLDQTGGSVADVLSDVARLDRINVAIRMVEKDRKEKASLRKVREADLLSLNQKLSRFDGLDEVLLKVRQVEAALERIEKHRARVEILNRFIDQARRIQAAISELTGAEGIQIPDASPLGMKAEHLMKVVQFALEGKEKGLVIKALSGIETVNVPSLDSSGTERLQQLEGWVTRMRALKGMKELENIDSVQIPTLPNLPFSEFVVRVNFAEKSAALTAKINALSEEEIIASKEAAMAHAELDALGYCPTCVMPIARTSDAHV